MGNFPGSLCCQLLFRPTQTLHFLRNDRLRPGICALSLQFPGVMTKFIAYKLPNDFPTHLRGDRNAIPDASRLNQSKTKDGAGSSSANRTTRAESCEIESHHVDHEEQQIRTKPVRSLEFG